MCIQAAASEQLSHLSSNQPGLLDSPLFVSCFVPLQSTSQHALAQAAPQLGLAMLHRSRRTLEQTQQAAYM